MDNQPPILPPTPITKPNNPLPVLLSLLALFFLATTALFAYQTTKLQKQLTALEKSLQSSSTLIPTVSPVNETVPWQTYTNPKHGYQISFPSDWKKLAGPPEAEDVFNFQKGDYEIASTVFPTSAKTLQEYLKQYDQETKTAWEGNPSIKVISSKLTTIGSNNVVQREEEWLAASFLKPVINTYFLNNGYIYSLGLRYIGSTTNPAETANDTYNQVLASFKFTAPTPTSQTQTVKLYFHDLSKDPQVLTCQANSFENRQIPATQTPLTATINLLIQDSFSKDQNYTDRLKNFKLVSATVTNGVAKLTFSDPQYFTSGGSCRIAIITDSLEKTAKQFPSVRSVQLLGAPFQP